MTSKSTLDALPKPFVTAMRTLFDVMDDKRTGYVRLTDIEKRWHEENGNPNGVGKIDYYFSVLAIFLFFFLLIQT